MKKLLSLLFVFTLIACGGSDDDSQDENNDSTPQNTLTIGNNSYNLQDGVIIDFGDWWGDEDGCPENFNLDIELYEDTIVTDDTGRVVSGSGKYIYFEMVSNGENLSNGDYSDIVNEANRVFNRNYSSISELYDAEFLEEEEESCFDLNGFVSHRFVGNIVDGEEQYEDDQWFSFLDGNLEFTRNSSNEITINLTGATMDESGLPVTVNFTGFLAAIDSREEFNYKNDFTRTKPRKN